MKDYYTILGVTETATQDEIKKTYRKLSKQYHPDVNPDGEEKFKEITEAYENIGEESKRNEYDIRRKNPFHGMGGSPFDIHSMFEQMMNGGTPKQKRAPDKVINITINPLESYFGTKKELTLKNLSKCTPCQGTGGAKKICDTCQGQGMVVQVMGTGLFAHRIQTTCPTCQGSGSQILNACTSCFGNGRKVEDENLMVNIPPNVDNGDFLRLSQKGDFDPGSKLRGDLILKVNLINDDKFEKSGFDLIYNLRIHPLNLILDDELIVEHPDGNLSIKIPESITTSKPLRIVGKGYKTNQGNGNFYIKVIVEKQGNLDSKLKEELKHVLKLVTN